MPRFRADCSRDTHPFATRNTISKLFVFLVRLACLIHAASVRSEPESNSPLKKYNVQVDQSVTTLTNLLFGPRAPLLKVTRSAPISLFFSNSTFTD